jgi:hypothetical protein
MDSKEKREILTLNAVLFFVVVVLVTLGLLIPAITDSGESSKLVTSLANMRLIYIAAQQAALDGAATGNTNLCWPGDNPAKYVELRSYLTMLAQEDYLPEAAFSKILSGPGYNGPQGTNDATAATIPFRVYKVRTSDTNTVLLATKNLPPFGGPLQGKPFGNKGFVVMNKNGSGGVYKSDQGVYTNLFGTFCSNYFEK